MEQSNNCWAARSMHIRIVSVCTLLLIACDSQEPNAPSRTKESPSRDVLTTDVLPEHIPPGYHYNDHWERCGWNSDGSCPDGCVTVFQDVHGRLSALGYFSGRPKPPASMGLP
jgi:hypothetical protein